MHLKMRFQMHLKNAFKRWEIFPKGNYLLNFDDNRQLIFKWGRKA